MEPDKYWLGTLKFDCSPFIAESDIVKLTEFFRNENDRRVLRGAMTLLGTHNRWVWRDAAIKCVGVDLHITFWAGACRNRFIVHLGADYEVERRCEQSGWRLKFRNAAVQAWEVVKRVASFVSPALRAIAWW